MDRFLGGEYRSTVASWEASFMIFEMCSTISYESSYRIGSWGWILIDPSHTRSLRTSSKALWRRMLMQEALAWNRAILEHPDLFQAYMSKSREAIRQWLSIYTLFSDEPILRPYLEICDRRSGHAKRGKNWGCIRLHHVCLWSRFLKSLTSYNQGSRCPIFLWLRSSFLPLYSFQTYVFWLQPSNKFVEDATSPLNSTVLVPH
jgi:hypothetical protein